MVNEIVQETQSKYQSPLCNEKLPFTSTFFFFGGWGWGALTFSPYILSLTQLYYET